MIQGDRSGGRPTRRGVLRSGGSILAGGLLAGCTGNPFSSTSSTNASQTANDSTAPDDSGYSVTMAPMGEVSFESPPKRVFTVFPQYADMAVALGYGDSVNAVYVPEMSGTTMNHYYDQLDGVSFAWKDLADPLSDGLSKELLYNLESDVHLADPAWASTQKKWDQSDVQEIQQTLGPWFGSFYSGTHADPPKAYADRYQYYTLWELFGNVASVFQEQERYRALKQIYTDLLSTIESGLPPKEERPTAVRVTLSKDTFWTYHLNRPGYWFADTRPLGAIDAFADRDWEQLWGKIGYETMVEADPDVILHLWGVTPNYQMSDVREKLKNHPVGQQLSAVENDQVYAQGMRYQGPIMNLFQLEMTAKQLYPEQFGEWPGYVDGNPYPEIPASERLFDRKRVSDAIAGTD
ncbi:ABC transporter substrate-binding protein [Halocatena marina]|uniref:ABC transporter substrate-binding protein n=1 Tax=Halocatena marina TaxID=2934937 RepID=UPI00200FA451|nr:ABC transporter substrate-binding protein [Halocatena marina]